MLSINISELLLTILSFFVLMFLLDRLLFRPVIRFREERQGRMDESFRREAQAKERQEQAREEVRQQYLASQQQARDMAAQAKARAEEERLAAEQEMEREAQAAMAQAEEDTQALRAVASRSLERQRNELAKTLADRLSQ